MPLNIPALLVPFHLLINPRLILPGLSVKDIRQLDFRALRKAGYRGAVFDKDNCLTLPHQDTLIPELNDAWDKCRDTFGHNNVLIVSNSAGSRSDAGSIQAEAVTYHLSAPVLRHPSLKPSYACIQAIRAYFGSLKDPIRDDELVVVGDRIFTDVVLANRMRKRRHWLSSPSIDETGRPGVLAVWTTRVWEKESMMMRWAEKKWVESMERWSGPGNVKDMGTFVRQG